MKIKYLVYTAIILLIGYLVYNRFSSNKKLKEPEKRGGSVISVTGIVVQPQRFANKLDLAGSIEANEAIDVRSEIAGLVKNIRFTEGSYVTKGSVLLTISDAELQAQLSQAITRQKLASQNENRARQLLQKEAISQEEYDGSLAELNTLKAETSLINAQLSKTVIRAPFSGRIGLRNVSVGSYVTPTTPIAQLASTNPVKISFSVPEKYAGMLQKNTAISFTVSGTNKKFTAKVYAVDPAINVESRTLLLKALAANPDNILIPGQFANISFPLTDIDDALLVPTEAVVPVLNGKKVFISESGKAKEVSVEAGTRTDSLILISSGIKPGDTVLTTGMMALKEGTPVKVTVAKVQKP